MSRRLLVAQLPCPAEGQPFVAPARLDAAGPGRSALSVSLVYAPPMREGAPARLLHASVPEGVTAGGDVLAARLAPLLAQRPRVEIDGAAVSLEPWSARQDVTTGHAVVTFRGEIAEPAPGHVALLFVDGQPADAAVVRETGHIAPALGTDDERVPDDAELVAARMGAGAPTSTTLSFDEYVRVAVLLMEADQDRATTLSANGMTEDRWLVEETAWLGRMGDDATNGDPSLAVLYGELVTRERARHAKPSEERPLEAYARIRVELERRADPSRVLADHGLTTNGYFRLDAEWEARADREPSLRARLDALLEAEHGRLDAAEARP